MDKYTTPHSKPNPHENELLTVLIEEAAEVIMAGTKLQRFGRDDGYPGTERTNGQDLGREIGEFLELVDRVVACGLTTQGVINSGKILKAKKLETYLQTSANERFPFRGESS
jgi:hypothetical protein